MARQLSSLIVPSVFGPTILEDSLNKNILVSSGVVPRSADMDAYIAGPGNSFTFPSFINPDMTGVAANVMSTDMSVNAVPEVITSRAQKFVKNGRDRSFISAKLNRPFVGKDPLDAVLNAASAMQNSWRQASLLAHLGALLDPTNGVLKANTSVIAAEATGSVTSSTQIQTDPIGTIMAAIGKAFGDQDVGNIALIMHPDVYWKLVAKNVVTTLAPSIQDPRFQYFAGFPVLLDKNVGKRAGTTSGFVYTIYAIRAGAVQFGTAVAPDPIEVTSVPLVGNGAGGDQVVIRDIFGFHVPGTSYTGSFAGDFPTDAELGNTSNWGLVWSAPSIGLASIVVNI